MHASELEARQNGNCEIRLRSIEGVVREVYEITNGFGWLDLQLANPHGVRSPNRWEFVGRLAQRCAATLYNRDVSTISNEKSEPISYVKIR